MPSPAVDLARALIAEAVACGVREVVLCPGSRSAPLAYAALAAADAGLVRLHVRVDERSAAFLALGLAKMSRRPALVVTTSGTAVANLHPAVLEAHHGCVPLIVVSADRPRELRHSGANQTTVQPGIFGGAVRWEVDVEAPGEGGDPGAIRTIVRRAYAAAAAPAAMAVDAEGDGAAETGAVGTGPGDDPGPVHVNLCLREPLVPDTWPLPEGRTSRPDTVPPSESEARMPPRDTVPQSESEARTSEARTGQPDNGAPPTPPGMPQRAPDALREFEKCSGTAVSGTPLPSDAVGFPRTLVVLGDLVDPAQRPVVSDFARHHGYPLVAEPFGLRSASDAALPHGPLLLTVSGWLDTHPPERVLVVGRPTLSRAVLALLRRPGLLVEAVTDRRLVPDPAGVVRNAHPWSALADDSRWPPADREWAQAWTSAGDRLAGLVAADPPPWGSGLAVARTVLAALPSGARLFLGSSSTVRDVDLAPGTPTSPPDGAVSSSQRRSSVANHGASLRTPVRPGMPAAPITIVASRGLAGIDGCVATAAGLALAEGTAYALMGDLTFLHDANALLIGPGEPRPDLTIVVVNDDGGGIFSLLEPGDPVRAGAFERVFATPTGTDLAALCAAHGVTHRRATTPGALTAALLTEPRGIRVIEVPTDRSRHRADHDALRAVAARL